MQERLNEPLLDPRASYGYLIEPAFIIYKHVLETGKEITPREALEEFLRNRKDKSRIVHEVRFAKARGLSDTEILATPGLILNRVPTWWDAVSLDEDGETLLAELEELLMQRIACDETLTPLDKTLGRAAANLQRHVDNYGEAWLANLEELEELHPQILAHDAALTPLDRLLGKAAVMLKHHVDPQR